MSLESFFSVVGGAVILHESMTVQAYIGCALMLTGTILAQLPSRRKHKKTVTNGGDGDVANTAGMKTTLSGTN
jgi:hypothetical protein